MALSEFGLPRREGENGTGVQVIPIVRTEILDPQSVIYQELAGVESSFADFTRSLAGINDCLGFGVGKPERNGVSMTFIHRKSAIGSERGGGRKVMGALYAFQDQVRIKRPNFDAHGWFIYSEDADKTIRLRMHPEERPAPKDGVDGSLQTIFSLMGGDNQNFLFWVKFE